MFFIVLHQTQASQRILTSLNKFDQELVMGGSKNPNFDLVIKMGRNQRYCEDYQILIPMTAYGSKLELKRPRYRENGIAHRSMQR